MLFVDPPTDREDVNRPPAPCERRAVTQFLRDSAAAIGQLSRERCADCGARACIY